jgi:hypothetical protein
VEVTDLVAQVKAEKEDLERIEKLTLKEKYEILLKTMKFIHRHSVIHNDWIQKHHSKDALEAIGEYEIK